MGLVACTQIKGSAPPAYLHRASPIQPVPLGTCMVAHRWGLLGFTKRGLGIVNQGWI